MFYNFNYIDFGFNHDDWDTMPCGDRRITRDYVLNGCNRDMTMIYGYYETVYQVRNVEKKYRLDKRIKPKVSLTDFEIAW